MQEVFADSFGMDLKELHMPVLRRTSMKGAPSLVQERFPEVFGMEMKELRIRPATRTVRGRGFGETAPAIDITCSHGSLSAHERHCMVCM